MERGGGVERLEEKRKGGREVRRKRGKNRQENEGEKGQARV